MLTVNELNPKDLLFQTANVLIPPSDSIYCDLFKKACDNILREEDNPLDKGVYANMYILAKTLEFKQFSESEIVALPEFNSDKYGFYVEIVVKSFVQTFLKLLSGTNMTLKTALLSEALTKINEIGNLFPEEFKPSVNNYLTWLNDQKEENSPLPLAVGFNLWPYGNERLQKFDSLLKQTGFIESNVSTALLFTDVEPTKLIWKGSHESLVYLFYLLFKRSDRIGNFTISAFVAKSFNPVNGVYTANNLSKSLYSIKSKAKVNNKSPDIISIEKIVNSLIEQE